MPQVLKIKQHPERAVPDEAAEILAQGYVAHVGFFYHRGPLVIPFSYHFDREDPDRIYIHGSPASRALKHLAGGAPVCVEVTLLDGLVYSKSAKYHSLNYRSVVCVGKASLVTDVEKKVRIFEASVGRYFPGRRQGIDYAPATDAHLTQTLMLEIQIEQWSAKQRTGGPTAPEDAKSECPGSAGVRACGVDVSSA